jgi:hypothetical protein
MVRYLIAGLALACLVLGIAGWAEHQRAGIAAAKLADVRQQIKDTKERIEALKKQAADQLAAEQATVLAQQKRLDAAALEQGKTDATNRAVVDRLHDELRTARLRALRAEEARRGGGGGGAASGDPIGAFARAGGGAQARGLLPAPPSGAAEEDADAYDADILNLAYASCRADALKLREVMAR